MISEAFQLTEVFSNRLKLPPKIFHRCIFPLNSSRLLKKVSRDYSRWIRGFTMIRDNVSQRLSRSFTFPRSILSILFPSFSFLSFPPLVSFNETLNRRPVFLPSRGIYSNRSYRLFESQAGRAEATRNTRVSLNSALFEHEPTLKATRSSRAWRKRFSKVAASFKVLRSGCRFIKSAGRENCCSTKLPTSEKCLNWSGNVWNGSFETKNSINRSKVQCARRNYLKQITDRFD